MSTSSREDQSGLPAASERAARVAGKCGEGRGSRPRIQATKSFD